MIESLQVVLAGLGGLVLAGLAGHAFWQSRKPGMRRAAPRPEAEPAPAREPSLGESGEAAQAGPAGEAVPQGAPERPGKPVHPAPAKPQAADAQPPLATVMAPVAPPRRIPPRLDSRLDAIAQLAVDAPVSGDFVLAHLPATRRVGSKPHWIEAYDEAAGQWELPQPGRLYRELRAGVQLASRTGALNEIEYSEFVQKVQAFADAVGAAADFRDMLDVVSQARELDAFAGQHDAQLACRLHARSAAWSVGYVQQQALAHGFMPGPVPGRFVLPGSEEGGPPVLTLQFDAQAAFADDPNQSAVRELLLSFDVPQTPAAEQPFEVWHRSALALAGAMDAVIADDEGQLIVPESFEAIGRELGQLYARLESAGLATGTPAARRLFS